MTQYVKIMKDDELAHFGVLGMKWGKRTGGESSTSKRVRTKDLQKSQTRQAFDKAKANKKAAYEDFSDAYDNYSKNVTNAFTKKGEVKWQKLSSEIEKSNKADAEFKSIKTERKNKIKAKTAELNKNATTKEKMIYNSATRKLAAKYVVDHDMSVTEATKRAQGDAWRNTAIFVGAYAAIGAASLYAQSR